MYRLYLGLWWFCFIQWPLFFLIAWAKNKHLFNCLTPFLNCKLDGLFVAYMMLFAKYMLLPLILTISMFVRANKVGRIPKKEKVLAIGSWIFSFIVIFLLMIGGQFRT